MHATDGPCSHGQSRWVDQRKLSRRFVTVDVEYKRALGTHNFPSCPCTARCTYDENGYAAGV